MFLATAIAAPSLQPTKANPYLFSTSRFHPGYLTAEQLAKAKKLKLAITAGISSDHVDLNAANKTNKGITVVKVTSSNVVLVAEHVIITILVLVRTQADC